MSDDDPFADTELDAAEALRWCARHRAQVDFDLADGRRVTEVTLAVPLRAPRGEVKRYRATVHLQARAPELVVELQGRTLREALGVSESQACRLERRTRERVLGGVA